MINYIISELNDQILTKDVSERVGGLVMPVQIRQEGGGILTVPISHDVDGAECWETGKYKDLLPNDRYKTVTFWEQRSDAAPIDNGFYDSKKKFRYLSVDLRLVCWVNLKELGYTDLNVTDRIQATILEAVWNSNGQYLIDETDYKIRFEVMHQRTVNRQPGIFDAYSVDTSALMYPFDFFGIDFNVQYWYGVDCFTEVTAGTPVDCVTY
jgi:hypothetical protein